MSDKWLLAVAAARDLIQNALVRAIVAQIDKIASGDAIAVFEAVDGWLPRSTLYMVVYVRLLDQGWPVEFDMDYFRGLSGVPDGLVEALLEQDSVTTH